MIDWDKGHKFSQIPDKSFKTIVDKTSALIFVIQDRKICYVNSIVELTTGYSQSLLLTNLDFYLQLNPHGYEPDDLKANYHNELKIDIEGKQECWLNCGWAVVEWLAQPAILITAIDVTKYKQQQAETDRALIMEQELCQNKTKFVSMVSHEFRTPLNIISFSTSLLKRYLNQWDEAKQLKYLNRLQTAVEQLGSLMDEVLIIGRAEAGKLEFNPQLFDLDLFCHHLLTEINLSQKCEREINFVNQSQQKAILADKNLLKLVLVNLLGNAIKYSADHHRIQFIVASERQKIVLKIVDRGIGIPIKEQSLIFEPFYRSSNVGDLPGNGLGLAIVKKIVELQGGKMSLVSEINIGSTFIIEIPLRPF